FIGWKSSRLRRKTVVLTRRSRPLPASSRIARRFANTCSVCSSMPPAISPSPVRRPSWPETNTKPPAAIACEYGAPWNGAGAASVRTTRLSAICSSFGRRLRERNTQRLEDRLEHVLGVLAVQQPDVQRHAGAVGEAFEEPADDVGAEPADAGLGEVDVRDDERLVGALEDDARERLGRRHRGGPVPARVVGPERLRERAAEGAAGLLHLDLGAARAAGRARAAPSRRSSSRCRAPGRGSRFVPPPPWCAEATGARGAEDGP